jgi:hypothetical protein
MSNNQIEGQPSEKSHLVPEVVSVIADKGMTELLADQAEAALDLALDEGVIKEIPVVGSLVKLYKVGVGVREHLFLKKLLRFLRQLESVSDEERQEFRERVSKDPEYRNKVGEKILLLLERADEMEKPALIGKAFAAYLQNQINYEQFSKMASGIDRALMYDLLQLGQMEKPYLRTEEQWGANLMSAGLMSIHVGQLIGGNHIDYFLNETGKLVHTICFEKAVE